MEVRLIFYQYLFINLIELYANKCGFYVALVCRYDLRIRYIPVNFLEKFQDDRSTLVYFYQQVAKDSIETHLSFLQRFSNIFLYKLHALSLVGA